MPCVCGFAAAVRLHGASPQVLGVYLRQEMMEAFFHFLFRADVAFILFPPIVYWITACGFHAFIFIFEKQIAKYRVQPPSHLAPNRVSKSRVVFQVLVQQIMQAILSFVPALWFPHADDVAEAEASPLWISLLRMLWGAVLFDTWQYWMHRAMHQNRWLYSKVHAHHHRLLMPYAFGALFNHPLEAFMLDTCAGIFATIGAQLRLWEGTILFSFAMVKTVDDHSGYEFPWDPIPRLFSNNTSYHDVHHQIRGLKYNFSQPFFSFWDRVGGTYWDPAKLGSVYAKSQYQASEVTNTGEPVWKSE